MLSKFLLYWTQKISSKINKVYLILGAVIIALGVGLAISINMYNNAKDDAKRLKVNQEAILTEMETYKTKSGKDAVTITSLELTVGEFKKLCEEQANDIKDMGIKISKLQSTSKTVTNTNVNVKTVLRDTVLVTTVDSVPMQIPVKKFEWNDAWNTFRGYITKDTIECQYEGRDTVIVAVHKVPKKFLFFKWGCKRIDVNVTNSNPNTKITYRQDIRIKD